MWTIIKTALGGLRLNSVLPLLALLGFSVALGVQAWTHQRVKAELAQARAAFAVEQGQHAQCEAVVRSYEATSERLKAEHRVALEKVRKASQRTRQLVSQARGNAPQNTLESIRTEGLSTAPDAAALWGQQWSTD